MLATIPAAVVLGVDGQPVIVEVHVSTGLPGYTVVGLPDAACRESRDRVRAALLSSDLPFPLKRVTVNLAPSGVRKEGSGLDLAIAVGLLVAQEVVTTEAVAGLGFLGELGLDGSIRRIPGVVSMVDALTAPTAVVPRACAAEAALLGKPVRSVANLAELVDALTGEAPWPPPPDPSESPPGGPDPDLADVRGQHGARLALEVAAAGGHHLLMIGPPGAGKTMLARRLPGLLPGLDPGSAIEVTRVHSAAGLPLPEGLVRRPPLRAPHHSATAVSLVGGGTASMRPGEISCAHRGVLFLDELTEFAPAVLDQLRQPLEEGVIRVARARSAVSYPARFLLVAAMNPCPCGSNGTDVDCACRPSDKLRYERRISGPLLDRFDLRVPVGRPDAADLLAEGGGECTTVVAARVAAARSRAAERGVECNAHLPAPELDRWAPLDAAARSTLRQCIEKGTLSARGLARIRRVALTVADLRGTEVVGEGEIAQALLLRASVGVSARLAA